MAEIHWTPKIVEVYLNEAADTLRRLPEKRIQGYVSAWPDIVHDEIEDCDLNERRPRLGPPSAQAIDQMERTLLWLRWLDRDDQKLVWDRANGRPWKVISRERGIDRTTGWRRWTYALVIIAARLNAGVSIVAITAPHYKERSLINCIAVS
ncbi:DUF6362 domain-containing protein [Azospirillaceae bacterium]